jgi:hypothetical protein
VKALKDEDVLNNNPRVVSGYVLVYILLFLTLFVPGYLFIFLFQKAYFFQWSNFQLIIISLAIAMPVITLNLAHLLNVYRTANKEFNFINALYKAQLFSILVLYIPNVIGYFMEFNLVAGVVTMIITQFIVSITLVISRIREM